MYMLNAKTLLTRLSGPLFQSLDANQRLLDAIRLAVPARLRSRCLGCWLNRRGQLILVVDGQEYAAQLRFFCTAILGKARETAKGDIRQVVFRAATPETKTIAPSPASLSVSRLIEAEAKACNNKEIGDALSRLAAAMAKRGNEDSLE